MSKLRMYARHGEKMRRTTITVDHDTYAGLQWLRRHARERVAASSLLRDAAAEALHREGMAVMLGKVMTIEARSAELDAAFEARLNAAD